MRVLIAFFAGVGIGASIAAVRHGTWTSAHAWVLFSGACAVAYLLVTRARKGT